MLREKNIAPFSKWEKELPKILFDDRYKVRDGEDGGVYVVGREQDRG